MERICSHAKVTGQVQGVFFRDSAKQHANSLGLTGWIRNVQDGSVEVMACGERSQVEAFINWLWQGPPMASVDNVDSSETDWQEFERFEVTH